MLHFKSTLYKMSIYVLIMALSINFLSAQSHETQQKISTSPFADGVKHWYNIKDKNNIIDPTPNQPQYQEADYINIANNILLFQRQNGGWPKNYDMKAILTSHQVDKVKNTKHILNTTFDNSTTYTHVYYLAQVYTVSKQEKYKEACIKGIEFILEAQYKNGGWPQYYPLEDNYSRHITFNDGAYVGIMNLFKKIKYGTSNFLFLEEDLKKRVSDAFDKGLECILKMQIENQGKFTAWCQQHDEVNLAPVWARAFEPPCICNGESAFVVTFLMALENPNEKIVNTIQNAVRWFEDSKIFNTRIETFEIEPFQSKYTTVKQDRRVVIDSTANPIWTRYYELGTSKPLFCDRNSKYLYSMSEVSVERRIGYAWYTYAPQLVLDRYPEWQKKWAPNHNVLKF